MPKEQSKEQHKEDKDMHLTCPKHGNEHPRMAETDDAKMVRCLRCGYVFQNVIRYPVLQLHKRFTGEIVYQNALTGEYVDMETTSALNAKPPDVT